MSCIASNAPFLNPSLLTHLYISPHQEKPPLEETDQTSEPDAEPEPAPEPESPEEPPKEEGSSLAEALEAASPALEEEAEGSPLSGDNTLREASIDLDVVQPGSGSVPSGSSVGERRGSTENEISSDER